MSDKSFLLSVIHPRHALCQPCLSSFKVCSQESPFPKAVRAEIFPEGYQLIELITGIASRENLIFGKRRRIQATSLLQNSALFDPFNFTPRSVFQMLAP